MRRTWPRARGAALHSPLPAVLRRDPGEAAHAWARGGVGGQPPAPRRVLGRPHSCAAAPLCRREQRSRGKTEEASVCSQTMLEAGTFPPIVRGPSPAGHSQRVIFKPPAGPPARCTARDPRPVLALLGAPASPAAGNHGADGCCQRAPLHRRHVPIPMWDPHHHPACRGVRGAAGEEGALPRPACSALCRCGEEAPVQPQPPPLPALLPPSADEVRADALPPPARSSRGHQHLCGTHQCPTPSPRGKSAPALLSHRHGPSPTPSRPPWHLRDGEHSRGLRAVTATGACSGTPRTPSSCPARMRGSPSTLCLSLQGTPTQSPLPTPGISSRPHRAPGTPQLPHKARGDVMQLRVAAGRAPAWPGPPPHTQPAGRREGTLNPLWCHGSEQGDRRDGAD